MKDNNPADNLAWRVIWRLLISSVGSQARMLRRSMLALLLAAFMQGIAFACLYPIIDALLRGDAPQLLNWAMAFSVAAIVTLVLRWCYAGMAWALNTVVIWRRPPMSCACDLASSYAACRWRSSSAAGRVK